VKAKEPLIFSQRVTVYAPYLLQPQKVIHQQYTSHGEERTGSSLYYHVGKTEIEKESWGKRGRIGLLKHSLTLDIGSGVKST